MFKKIFQFKGCIGRSEYALSTIGIYLLLYLLFLATNDNTNEEYAATLAGQFVASYLLGPGIEIMKYLTIVLQSVTPNHYDTNITLIYIIAPIIPYWIILAQGAKRCYDLGYSSWRQIIPFYCLILLLKKETTNNGISNGNPIITSKDDQLNRAKDFPPSEPIHYGQSKKLNPETGIIDSQTKKYIGYNTVDIFEQAQEIHYPYVIMPNPNSIVKYPQEGRLGRRGHKENEFKKYIDKYFENDFEIYNDKILRLDNGSICYEPDCVLINRKKNILIDIEIDEPYEGINDIDKRKAIHYRGSDDTRNHYFKLSGWITIRFAEIQIHQQPDSCCKFIAEVIKSIESEYIAPNNLEIAMNIFLVNQWSKKQAKEWSIESYREKYLGIDSFGLTDDNSLPMNAIRANLTHSAHNKEKEPKNIYSTECIKKENTTIISIFTFKGYNLEMTKQGNFVKVLLNLPKENTANVISLSDFFSNPINVENESVGKGYIRDIFLKSDEKAVFKWDDELSFSDFLSSEQLNDDCQDWFKCVYIKIITDEKPRFFDFLSERHIYNYVNKRIYRFDLSYIKNSILFADQNLVDIPKNNLVFSSRI